VQFDLRPEERVLTPLQTPTRERSPERERERENGYRDRDQDGYEGLDDEDRERGRRSNNDKAGRSSGSTRHRQRDDSPDSVASDDTIELPPRLDASGRKKDDDPLAVKLESVLSSILR